MPELFVTLCALVCICAVALVAGAVEYIINVVRIRRRVKLVRVRIQRSLARERARIQHKLAARERVEQEVPTP